MCAATSGEEHNERETIVSRLSCFCITEFAVLDSTENVPCGKVCFIFLWRECSQTFSSLAYTVNAGYNHRVFALRYYISMKHAIRFEHDALHFSASHFITFGTPEKVEALHGHNFRVKAEVSGPLNRREYVVDFLVAFNALKQICETLSHKVLIPQDHPDIAIKTAEDTVYISLPPLQWGFPAGDTLILPVRNTTTESMAKYIAEYFRKLLEQESAFEMPPPHYTITLELEESPGMWAVFRDH